ncbi:MAG: V-type ATPase subunit [Chitinispirillaceae bacterium]|nr:V-type ATPase subunit [Chitinispirillaceae bacterium]
MFTEVGKYALINAKLRARISTILDDDFFTHLIKCPSLTEMFNLLRTTAFADLPGIYERTGDLKMVERELSRKESLLFRDIEPHLPPDVLALSRAYTAGYEIEHLKNALRLFFDHRVRKQSIDDSLHYLLRENILHRIPFDAVVNSTSFDEIVSLLSSTPYGDLIRSMLPEVERQQSLFPLSNALDRFYYRRLLEEVTNLPPRDRAIALRLVGIEIDLQNINWIIRFRTFYNLSFDTVAGLIIPGGLTVRGNTLQEVFHSQQIAAPLQSMLRKNYPGITALLSQSPREQSSRLVMIERILEQIMLEEIRRIRCGYPFSVGIILAYYVLKRREIKRMRTVLNAGLLNVSRERTASLV